MKKLVTIALLPIIIITFTHCKKSSSPSAQGTSSCPISAIDQQSLADTLHWALSYDDQQRLRTANLVNNYSGQTSREATTFQYGNGYVISTFIVNGTPYEDSL